MSAERQLSMIKSEFLLEIDELLKLYLNYISATNVYLDFVKPVKYPWIIKKIWPNCENPIPIYYVCEGLPLIASETTDEIYKKFESGGHQILTNIILTQIYNLWEDKYRQKIANIKNLKKDEVCYDIFGELKNIRVSITHKQHTAKGVCIKNKILKKFKPGEKIIFSGYEFFDTIIKIKEQINNLI
ncbi:MAG: hypothetical protein PHN22_04505 [Candidatus ainarchaeum sp.]|nr:hypothetical protein [Candidatus ainarchaeum sp.]